MKKKLLPILIIGLTLLLFPKINFAQAPDIGTAAHFVLFTSVGAIGNTGYSQLTGKVGTNTGATTGFGNVNGGMHNTDAATARAAADLTAAYNQLNSMIPTSAHAPVLGNGEILFAGVHALAAAASIVGNLILDAQGDSNAVFVITTGGALTTAAGASVSLLNGASACNVFWKIEGAASMAAGSTMRGNLIANNGAIEMGAGCILEGRLLSTAGSVTVYQTLAYTPLGCSYNFVLTGPAAPDLACAYCYTLFSTNGAVSNSGATYVTGDIGTNRGPTTGFNPSFVTGRIHPIPDPSTAQSRADLLRAYHHLDSLVPEIELLYPAQFGNGLVLTPHTYVLNAATSLTDTVCLNAQDNADAIFVIKIKGALTTSSYSNVKLINGAQAKNVYWVVEGAVTISAHSVFCGTIISNNGAIVLNTGVILNGKAYTTTGAITTTAVTANMPFYCPCFILENEMQSLTAVCEKQYRLLTWTMATEVNSNFFTAEGSMDGKTWQVVAKVAGAGNSTSLHHYSLKDYMPDERRLFYRLKQHDFNGNYKYSAIATLKGCAAKEDEELTVYPNPSNGKLNLVFTGDKPTVYTAEIFNASGEKIYSANNAPLKIDLSGNPTGVYWLKLILNSKIITRKILLKK